MVSCFSFTPKPQVIDRDVPLKLLFWASKTKPSGLEQCKTQYLQISTRLLQFLWTPTCELILRKYRHCNLSDSRHRIEDTKGNGDRSRVIYLGNVVKDTKIR